MSAPPSKNIKRVTRGSIRNYRERDEPNTVDAGGNQPNEAVFLLHDGLSSASEFNTESESEGEQATGSTPAFTDDEGKCEENKENWVPSAESDDDSASRRLAWNLAAQNAGEPVTVYPVSAEASQSDTEVGRETEYESALSADNDDQDTVVNVVTRETARESSADNAQRFTAEQSARAHEVYGILRRVTGTNPLGEREAQRADPAIAAGHQNRRSRHHDGPAADAAVTVVKQCISGTSVREDPPATQDRGERRPKSRHTRTATVPVPSAGGHQTARVVAAGDQNRKHKMKRREEELLPLIEPQEDDSYVEYGESHHKGQYQSREGGLRMPLFTGDDWAGFISQFEACIQYYGWTEKTKVIRLHTSISGDARKALGAASTGNWTFDQLKRHMERRYGKSKVYAQIQSELLAKSRKPGQSLHSYHDEIIAASYTANIPENKRQELVYTAFIYGLRANQHMHRWVTRRETSGTIDQALEIAEIYEDEFGSDPVLMSRPITVNARDSTGNSLAIGLPESAEQTTVSVDAVQTENGDASLKAQLKSGFQSMQSFIDKKFENLDSRLQGVETWQANQVRRWEANKAKYANKNKDNNRSKNWRNNRDNNRDDRQNGNQNSSSGGAPNGSNKGQNRNSADPAQEINARSSASADHGSGQE